jgi:hypothetical protein
MVLILSIISSVLLSLEYLHSMSCKLLLPLYVVSSTSCPFEFLLYPMALMMSGLWCMFSVFCALGVCFRELWWGVLLSLYRFVDLLVWLIVFVVCGPLVA